MRRTVWSAALAMVVLAAAPAAAHPNAVASGPVVAGQPLKLTLLVLGDEGEFDGVDVTFPLSVTVDSASSSLFTATTTAHSLSLRGGDLKLGTTTYVFVTVTPSKAEEISIGVTSHFADGRPDFVYAPLRIGVDGRAVGAPSGSSKGYLWPVGALVVTASALGFFVRRRYSTS